jgi:hypothetical protein
LEFECILGGINFLHEIRLVKHFSSEISLFKWELSHLYSYINIFSTEIALKFSTFTMDFGNKYLVLFNKNLSTEFPGQFVLYQRFYSQYSLDMEALENYPSIDTIIDFHYDIRKKNITLVGLSKDQIIRMRFGIRSFRIELKNPFNFLDKTVPFEFEFFNKNKFMLQFKIINSSLLEATSDNTRRVLYYLLVGLVVFSFVSIFVLLVVTVFLSKRKEELVLQLDLGVGANMEGEESIENSGTFRVSSLRINTKRKNW